MQNGVTEMKKVRQTDKEKVSRDDKKKHRERAREREKNQERNRVCVLVKKGINYIEFKKQYEI